ncbi:MAG TPA: hypothetical protein VM659_07315 [Dongiaceae bacterium]|nr:hypothetical protein [Dongiaceae bacterium]
MRRVLSAALPLTVLLLTACSDQPATQKADLQQAADAAKIAGEAKPVPKYAEAKPTQTYAPVQLGPSKQAVTNKPAPVAGTKQVTAAVPAAIPTQPDATAKNGLKSRPAAVSAAPMIAQPIAAGPAPSLASTPSVQPAKVADATPANGTAIHLASYREIASAQRGWQILSKSYHELAPLKPLYVAVDLPGKGHVLRLYGTGADARVLKEICHEMQTAGAYCADNIAF